MASSLLNGERAMVLLFVSSIEYSAPPVSFIYESLSFCLLAVFALFVEISLESYASDLPFKTRLRRYRGIKRYITNTMFRPITIRNGGI
ncbi:hypothetical protein OSB04_013519 [Centaurea solstitialis]|uniref:Uncharacterized protein n=1 Tax=Centaurea solstitialis TaxID=347529 RepID=A0AA38WNG3_9ASTR|nr:hypothetical protein OSB04_013519 [Centaurea solstitialis]